MIAWVIALLVLALVAGLLGFTTVAGQAMQIARILFYVFLVMFVLGLVFSLFTGRRGGGR